MCEGWALLATCSFWTRGASAPDRPSNSKYWIVQNMGARPPQCLVCKSMCVFPQLTQKAAAHVEQIQGRSGQWFYSLISKHMIHVGQNVRCRGYKNSLLLSSFFHSSHREDCLMHIVISPFPLRVFWRDEHLSSWWLVCSRGSGFCSKLLHRQHTGYDAACHHF